MVGLLLFLPLPLLLLLPSPPAASAGDIFEAAEKVDQEGKLFDFIRREEVARADVRGAAGGAARGAGGAVSPNLFDFVVVTSSSAFSSSSSSEGNKKDSHSPAPIDSLVTEQLTAAASRAASSHPFKSFVLKRGVGRPGGGPGGGVYLVGLDRDDPGRKVVYLYDGQDFEEVRQHQDGTLRPGHDGDDDEGEGGAEGVVAAPADDDADGQEELELWRQNGFLKKKEKKPGPAESSPSSFPPDFAPELLRDLGLDLPEHQRRVKRVRRSKRDFYQGDQVEADGDLAESQAEERSHHPYAFEGHEVPEEEESEEGGEDAADAADGADEASARDLVYEAMKMRTGFTESRDKEAVRPVGGGFLEKRVIGELVAAAAAAKEGGGSGEEGRRTGPLFTGGQEDLLAGTLSAFSYLRTESREMQCCHDLELTASAGVLECHPYALGRYRKIGACAGRSFYQHANNTDIFLYYACGGWYVGLEIGSCGGWLVAKSLELCASGQHQTAWTYFDEGMTKEDATFKVEERCQFYNDFRPIPHHPGSDGHHFRPPNPIINYPNQPVYQQQQSGPPTHNKQGGGSSSSSPVKHEHYHYHIKVGEATSSSSSSLHKKGYKPIGLTGGAAVAAAAERPPPPPQPPSPPLVRRPPPSYHYQPGDRFSDRYDLVRPGDQAVAFEVGGSGDVAFSRGSVGSPSLGAVVEDLYRHRLPDGGLHRQSSIPADRPKEDKLKRHQIMINNFHLPPQAKEKEQEQATATATATAAATTTSTSTSTTTPKPLEVVVVQRPASDLQMYQPQPLSVREKINQDLITLRQGVGDGLPESQNSPLVGYIIKRRRRPVYRPYDGGGDLEVTHEVQQFYGRSREPGGHHMEAGEEEEQRSYFPTN